MPRTNNRRTPRHSNAPRHALLGAGHGVLCVCVYWCVLLRSCRQRWTGRNTCRPAAAARLLAATRAAGRQACRGDRHAPSHHVVVVAINTMNDCAMRTLYDAHHWCAAARWPAHQAPRHTHTPHMYIIHYTYCVYTVQSRTPH